VQSSGKCILRAIMASSLSIVSGDAKAPHFKLTLADSGRATRL
jgi:hypothetical protein